MSVYGGTGISFSYEAVNTYRSDHIYSLVAAVAIPFIFVLRIKRICTI